MRKYDRFDFSGDLTIEVSRDFLGGTSHPDSAPYQVFGALSLVNVKIKRFDLTRDAMFDVSQDFVGEVLSSSVTTLLSLSSIDLVKVEI